MNGPAERILKLLRDAKGKSVAFKDIPGLANTDPKMARTCLNLLKEGGYVEDDYYEHTKERWRATMPYIMPKKDPRRRRLT